MKNEQVARVWKFYRDNCQGFKEPLRKEFRRLDEYVSSIESENAKLLEFVYDMWNDMNVYYTQHERPDSSDMDFYRDRMCELGVEVE